jgi:hypothetical protein
MTAMTDQATPTDAAARPFRFAMLVPTLVVGVAVPIAIFKILEALGVAPVWALGAGSIPVALNNVRLWVKSRRLEPIGILMLAGVGGGAVGSLVTGSLFSRIVTDCLLGSAWGLAFLGSLLAPRPVLFFILRQLAAGGDASRTDTWNGLWRHGAFRSAMRSITAAWGLSYFAGVLVELALTRMLTLDTVVMIGPIMSIGVTLLLVVFTRLAMRAMRERLEHVEHLVWPL